jgi:Fe-S cluster assembly iron-binding protein IscA
MIEMSDKAREKLLESLKQHGENPAVRVYIAGSG